MKKEIPTRKLLVKKKRGEFLKKKKPSGVIIMVATNEQTNVQHIPSS